MLIRMGSTAATTKCTIKGRYVPKHIKTSLHPMLQVSTSIVWSGVEAPCPSRAVCHKFKRSCLPHQLKVPQSDDSHLMDRMGGLRPSFRFDLCFDFCSRFLNAETHRNAKLNGRQPTATNHFEYIVTSANNHDARHRGLAALAIGSATAASSPTLSHISSHRHSPP